LYILGSSVDIVNMSYVTSKKKRGEQIIYTNITFISPSLTYMILKIERIQLKLLLSVTPNYWKCAVSRDAYFSRDVYIL